MQAPGPRRHVPPCGFCSPEWSVSLPGLSRASSFLPQPGPITEVDGAVASDFFTVLSTGQRFTEDQWLNMQAFSMLRKWLLHSGPEDPGSPDAGAPGRDRGTGLKYAVSPVQVGGGQEAAVP